LCASPLCEIHLLAGSEASLRLGRGIKKQKSVIVCIATVLFEFAHML